MNLRFLMLIMFLVVFAQPALPEQASEPLTKNQVMELVKFGMNSADLVKKIKEHGIDFQPTGNDLEALRKAGAKEAVIQAIREVNRKSLTRDQVGKLVAGGVPSDRAAALVKQRGIDFQADEEYLKTLRLAGGDERLIAALREASAAVTSKLVVATSPGAEVYVDGEPKGRAGSDGRLEVLKIKPGVHAIKVSLSGKKEFRQSITVVVGQESRVDAALAQVVRSNPKSLSREDILSLLQGDVPNRSVVEVIEKNGLKFTPTDDDLNAIRAAGGDDELIETIKRVTAGP